MNEYHTQTVKIGLKKDSALYRRIVKYAERAGVPVEAVIDTLVTLGCKKTMGEVLDELENPR